MMRNDYVEAKRRANYYIIALVIIILLIAVGILINRLIKTTNESKMYKENMEILNEQSTSLRTENGALLTTNSVLVGKNAEMLLDIKSDDETIQHLQRIVREQDNKNNRLEQIIAIKDNIIAQYSDSLVNNIISYDTVGDTIYPIYQREFVLLNPYKEEDTVHWISGHVSLGYSQFDIDLNIISTYDVTIARTRKSFFKSWEYKVTVVALNPYTQSDYVKSFTKNDIKRHPFGLGVIGGYGFGKDGLTPFVGIGVTYTFINF